MANADEPVQSPPLEDGVDALPAEFKIVYSADMATPKKPDAARLAVPDWLKISLAVIVPLLVALWAFSTLYLPAKIDSQTKEMSNDISSLKTDLTDIRSNVQRIDGTVNGMLKDTFNAVLGYLKSAKHASADLSRRDLQLAVNLASAAMRANVEADPNAVAEAGKAAIALTENPKLSGAAWKAVGTFLDYRSFLNRQLAPHPKQPGNHTPPYNRYFPYNAINLGAFPPGSKSVKMQVNFHGEAPPSDAALMDLLSKPPPPGLTSGAAFITVDGGGGIVLDGYRMKNVIIQNAEILYSGGPVVLDNVYFVNCTFNVRQSPNGVRLGQSILASASTTFKATPS